MNVRMTDDERDRIIRMAWEDPTTFDEIEKRMTAETTAEPRNNAIQANFSRRFRILLTGDPEGVPPWLDVVAAGEGPGLYLPTDAPWVAHGDLATLVGGIRALLMQALHPGSLAGVRSHSRYKDDPLGRLSGTIRWLTITTYPSVPIRRCLHERRMPGNDRAQIHTPPRDPPCHHPHPETDAPRHRTGERHRGCRHPPHPPQRRKRLIAHARLTFGSRG